MHEQGSYRRLLRMMTPDSCPLPLPGDPGWKWRRMHVRLGDEQAKLRKIDGISWECQVTTPQPPARPIAEFDYAASLWQWQVRAGYVTVAMGHRLTRKGAKRAAENAARAVWMLHNQRMRAATTAEGQGR